MKAIPSAALLLVSALAGCETASDILPPVDDILPAVSDILPGDILPSEGKVLAVGPDTFSVSASDLDPTVPTRVALVKAQDYCASRGREMLTSNIKVDQRWEKMGRRPVTTLTFQCLTKDQLDRARRKDAKPPDAPTENKSK